MAGRAKGKGEATADLTVQLLRREGMFVKIVGTTPLILNRMSEKAKRELLLPRGRKTAADKAASAKHVPSSEFHDSAHRAPADSDGPTRLLIPSLCFKAAMSSVAIDLPGVAKAVIGRLVYVQGQYVPVFGIPKLHMSVVRSADINRTPDIRTRVIVPEWASIIDVRWTVPLVNQTLVLNLLSNAGMIRGVGDWRTEKGKGDYGQFRLADPKGDAEWNAITKSGGRKAQDAALAEPGPYDDETADLLSWYDVEVARRGFKVA